MKKRADPPLPGQVSVLIVWTETPKSPKAGLESIYVRPLTRGPAYLVTRALTSRLQFIQAVTTTGLLQKCASAEARPQRGNWGSVTSHRRTCGLWG